MLQETQDREEIIERVAALDIGKAELMCCVRVPGKRPGQRLQEVRAWPAMTRSLLELADYLRGLGVTRVVMEPASDYWKPPFCILQAAGLETWLVNARDIKHLPGRPKTGSLGTQEQLRPDAASRTQMADSTANRHADNAEPAAGPGTGPRAPGRGHRAAGTRPRAPGTGLPRRWLDRASAFRWQKDARIHRASALQCQMSARIDRTVRRESGR
jgi:hypothetical protein